MNPLISVIIPVYNVEKYLQECLDSVFSQGYKDFEVICINDGSRDGSFAILEKYQRKHQNMHVYSNFKNSGLPYARNRGMELADGKYIFFIDADDTIAEDTFSLLAGKAEATGADIILFDYEEVYEDDVSGLFSFKRKRQDGRYKDFLGTYVGKDLLFELAEEKKYTGVVWASLYKRGFIEEKNLHFYEGIVHEDILFDFFAMVEAEEVICLNKKLYKYRRHANSITIDISEINMQSYFILLMEFVHYWKAHSSDEKMNAFFENYMRSLISGYKRFASLVGNSSPLKMGSSADKFLYEIFRRSDIRVCVDLPNEVVSAVKQAENVYIYGAGIYASRVLDTLCNLDLSVNVRNLIVSTMQGNPKELGNVEVVCMDAIHLDANDLILIAMRKEQANLVKKKLEASFPCRCMIVNEDAY